MSLPKSIELNSNEEHLATFYPRFVFYVGFALITGSSGLFLVIAVYKVIQAWQSDPDNFILADCIDALHDSVAWVIGRRAIHLTTERLIIESGKHDVIEVQLAEVRSAEIKHKVLVGNLKLQVHRDNRVMVLKVMQPTQLASEIQQACLASGGACPA